MSARKPLNLLKRALSALFLCLALPAMSFAETVGVFFDSSKPMDSFAAADVKTVLAGQTVEMKALSTLNASYPNKKIVIALVSDAAVTALLTQQGGTVPTGLSEQGYSVVVTTTPAQTYWVLGFDRAGAMYGGFQIAENIKFGGLTGNYAKTEKPFMKIRGEKLNIVFDRISGTYPMDSSVATTQFHCFTDLWDLDMWKKWFDLQARNRYNMVSFWCNSPFTSMVKMDPQYALANIQNVTDQTGKVVVTMSIDQKIAFWQQLMAYAHNRGIKVYFFTWNVYTGGAGLVYPDLIKDGDIKDETTRAFIYSCMTKMLETYPNLDGIGVTAGENTAGAAFSTTDVMAFLAQSYGKAVFDYFSKPANSTRKFHYVARTFNTTVVTIQDEQIFQDIAALPNVQFGVDFKYSTCSVVSTAAPDIRLQGFINSLAAANFKSIITARTDDLFFAHWADPAFVRAYCAGIKKNEAYWSGIVFGCDGFVPLKSFFLKDQSLKSDLDIERLWYRKLIFGRLMYNPETGDDVFKNYLKTAYPQVDQNTLFAAWNTASRTFQVGNEFIRGSFSNDYMYYPEAQLSRSAYVDVMQIGGAVPIGGSKFSVDMFNDVADSVNTLGMAAIASLNTLSTQTGGNARLALDIKNLQALACLGLFVGEKIRAGRLIAVPDKPAARDAMKKAYCYWTQYTSLMDQMIIGQSFARTLPVLPDWSSLNQYALMDIDSITGTKNTAPLCTPIIGVIQSPTSMGIKKQMVSPIRALTSKSVSINLPGDQGFSLDIFASNGAKVTTLNSRKMTKGVYSLNLPNKLTVGVYMVRLKTNGQVSTKQFNVCCD